MGDFKIMEQGNKKILLNFIYLAKEHAGGKDQFAFNLLSGIYDNGDISKVIVVCFDYLEDIVKKIAPTVKIVTIKSRKCSTELERMLQILLVNTWVIPKIIKKYSVSEIFHASCNNGMLKFDVPSVVIPHDIKAVSHRIMGNVKISWYKYVLYKVMYAMDFRHADKIIAISNSDKAEMCKFYPKYQDKIVQIYNPIKISQYDNVDKDTKPSNNNKLINQVSNETVATLEPNCKDSESKFAKMGVYDRNIVAINLQFHHKNIITLIKAYEKVRDKIKCNLILVGSVPKRVEYLKDYVKENNLEDTVIFTGFVNGIEKRKILLGCDLYINPSLFEGFGMTAVEAMILKVPTLLSKVSANYEVTAGLCRYYEPADDVGELAKAIEEYFNTPCTSSQLDEASSTMMTRYNYKTIASEYMDLFDTMK